MRPVNSGKAASWLRTSGEGRMSTAGDAGAGNTAGDGGGFGGHVPMNTAKSKPPSPLATAEWVIQRGGDSEKPNFEADVPWTISLMPGSLPY